jgi:hypothetical protein
MNSIYGAVNRVKNGDQSVEIPGRGLGEGDIWGRFQENIKYTQTAFRFKVNAIALRSSVAILPPFSKVDDLNRIISSEPYTFITILASTNIDLVLLRLYAVPRGNFE